MTFVQRSAWHFAAGLFRESLVQEKINGRKGLGHGRVMGGKCKKARDVYCTIWCTRSIHESSSSLINEGTDLLSPNIYPDSPDSIRESDITKYLKYICADCISEPGFLGAGNNVQGSDVEKLANWEDCAKKCGRVEACAFWTYDRG